MAQKKVLVLNGGLTQQEQAADQLIISDSTSATTPALAFVGDPNTGIYNSAADTLDISTGGSNRVSINTTAISGSLPVRLADGSAAAPSFSFTSDSDNGMYLVGANSLGFASDGTSRMTIDTEVNLTVALDMGTTNKIINLAEPTLAQDAATKFYVDSVAAGLDPKASCRVATTVAGGNIPGYVDTPNEGTITVPNNNATYFPNAGQPMEVDGVTLATNNRVLVKNQTDPLENGIYTVTTPGVEGTTDAVLTRSSDMDGTPTNEVSGGNFTFIETGTVNEGSGWVVVWDGIITLNTDPVDWTQFSNVTVSQPANQIVYGTGSSITSEADFTWNPSTNVLTITSGTIQNADGTASLPSYTFSNDPDTGMYRQGTNAIGLTVDAGEITRIDTNGLLMSGAGTRIRNNNGSLTVPSYTFTNDLDTGMFLDAGNDVTIVWSGSGTPSTIEVGDTITLTAANGDLLTVGASINLTGVDAATGSPITLSAGDSSAAVGAAISVTAGASTNPTSAGGGITLTTGAGNTSGTGGALSLLGGAGGTGGNGGNISLTGGTSGTSAIGGGVTLTGGTGGTTANGGAIQISGGNGPTAGAVNIDGGIASTAANGGNVNITYGYGATGVGTINIGTSNPLNPSGGSVNIFGSAATTGTAGSVTIQAGTGGTTGTAGSVSITAGERGSVSGSAGTLTMAAGPTQSGGTAGATTVRGGDAASTAGGIGGAITVRGGTGVTQTTAGTATGSTGGVTTITTGAPGAATNTAADANNATGGAGATLAVTGITGGAATLSNAGSTGNATGGVGTPVTITGGTGGASSIASAAGTSLGGNGGSITLTAGAGGTATGGATNTDGNGGNISLVAGTSGDGTDGSLIFTTDGTERLEIAGNGEWQVGGTAGTANFVLTSNGAGTPPTWSANNATTAAAITVTLQNTEGSTINKGDAVFVNGAGTVALGDANDDPDATKTIGLVFDTSIANIASGQIIVQGVITGLTGLTAGAIYYLSETGTTGNTLTTTAPTTSGSWIVPVGIALSTTVFKVNVLSPIQN